MYTFRYKKKREYDEKINPRFLIKRKVNCKKTIGLKIRLSLDSTQDDLDAKLSGYAEAVVLGVISEKIRIIMVRTIDPRRTLLSKKFIIRMVTNAEARMFAKLFPTRITDNKLSGFARSSKALLEFF